MVMTTKLLTRTALVFAFIGSLFWIGSLIASYKFFWWLSWVDPETAGSIGDFVGGVSSPLLTISATILVYITYKAQKEGHKETIKEIQSQVAQNAFFQIFELYLKERDSIRSEELSPFSTFNKFDQIFYEIYSEIEDAFENKIDNLLLSRYGLLDHHKSTLKRILKANIFDPILTIVLVSQITQNHLNISLSAYTEIINSLGLFIKDNLKESDLIKQLMHGTIWEGERQLLTYLSLDSENWPFVEVGFINQTQLDSTKLILRINRYVSSEG